MRGGGWGGREEKSGHRVLLSRIIIDATVAIYVHACIHPLIRRECEKWHTYTSTYTARVREVGGCMEE